MDNKTIAELRRIDREKRVIAEKARREKEMAQPLPSRKIRAAKRDVREFPVQQGILIGKNSGLDELRKQWI
jgi:hypothetical protein